MFDPGQPFIGKMPVAFTVAALASFFILDYEKKEKKDISRAALSDR